MNNWMQVKVKYTKQLDNGALRRVSEPYLLAAMSFTDAEARIHEELGSIIRGEFNVVAIARYDVHDIFAYADSDVWYKCKVKYESMDADTEKARKVTQIFLVSAASAKQAYERIQESLSTLMVDFEIPSVVVSPIVDIFPYSEQEEGMLLDELKDHITEESPKDMMVIVKNEPNSGEFIFNGETLRKINSAGDITSGCSRHLFSTKKFLVVSRVAKKDRVIEAEQ